ncbi:hypothetical protein FN924_13525 [Radiobacillus deserti]|uniref:Uncharacterized protein n=1 Tax=Radiobacillus deserti TaxID=2594883 RepID=A0A516KI97_9BACI|nr:hypothetical protein FN924_13525 [Radiobacillus deserti]
MYFVLFFLTGALVGFLLRSYAGEKVGQISKIVIRYMFFASMGLMVLGLFTAYIIVFYVGVYLFLFVLGLYVMRNILIYYQSNH